MNKLQITIKYPSGRLRYDKLHTAPAQWNELTAQHLFLWAATMASGLKVNLAKIILASKLYNIPKHLFKCLDPGTMLPVVASIDFLFKKNGLTKWLIPSVWRGLLKYYGPKDALVNITVDEYDKCEACYERFAQTGDRDYLVTLAAILYRPQRFWGIDQDIRIPLTAFGYINRAKRFKKLSPVVITAIYLNYEGCRLFIQRKFKGVFEKPAGGEALGQTGITPWAKIIESGSNDIFGPHGSTKQTMLYDFLSRLESRIREMKELEGKN